MTNQNNKECCPRFIPELWDDKVITWKNKRFVKDRVTSIFHILLNCGAIMEHNERAITTAG